MFVCVGCAYHSDVNSKKLDNARNNVAIIQNSINKTNEIKLNTIGKLSYGIDRSLEKSNLFTANLFNHFGLKSRVRYRCRNPDT